VIRRPVVSGRFYAEKKSLLRREIGGYTRRKKDRINALGVVSPHAGYVYSGSVAGEVFSSAKPKPAYVIIGPNHTGFGKPFGLDVERAWETPLGEVKTDRELAEAILRNCRHIEPDEVCHNYEHSIEVQLPFLQYLNKVFTFVPITISPASAEILEKIGSGIAGAVKELKRDVTVIASSDMTHYEPKESAEKKDRMVIEKMLALDAAGMLDVVDREDVSMCGFAPTAVMLSAAIGLGAKSAKLIKYGTSGDASGDYSAVVGYAGVIIY